MNAWYGYLHENGSIQVKRLFVRLDINEALDSPFVLRCTFPFKAENREEAIIKTKKLLGV